MGRADARDSFAMKTKSLTTRASQVEGLTFAWLRGDQSLVRFWFALILAVLIFGGFVSLLKITVESSLVSDRPRVGKAQLLLMNGDSHFSLQELAAVQRLPSLGVKESVGEAPLVGDLLKQLGLEAEEVQKVNLFPAPELVPDFHWPEKITRGLVLPALVAPLEKGGPQWSPKESSNWVLQIEGVGAFEGELTENSIPWSHPLPTEKTSLWSLVFDVRGRLVFASAVSNVDEDLERKMRQELQFALNEKKTDFQAVTILVALKFEQQMP